MKKFILVFKTHFKKSAIATMFLFVMAFWLVFLTGCNSNLFSADVEETTRSNVSQVIQEDFIRTSNTVNYPYGIKNEKGQETNVINSGLIYSQLRFGSTMPFEYITGDVFISTSEIFRTSSFDDYGFFKLSNITINFEWLRGLDVYEEGIGLFFEHNSDDICIFAFYDENMFTDYLSNIFEEDRLTNEYLDIVYTDYTFYELDTTAPSINGTTHVSIDVDNQPSIDEIVSHVYAYDETDGYVPVLVESSTYVQGVMEVGDYTIDIYALDSASNRNDAIINVHRYDLTSPTISGTDSYDLNYDNDLTLAKIESALTITDNVDNGLKLEKVSDTFTGNEHKLGNYQVVYRAKDNSNNMSANKTINIAVKNKGTAVIGGSRTIEVGTNELLTLAEFKSHISVIDGYDGVIANYTITGFDDYTSTSKVVGTNIIEVSYTNSGNNTATADFSIVKKDRLAPGFLFDDYFIQLKQGEVFTFDMIMNQVALILGVDVTQINSISGEYDVMTLGNYGIDVCLTTGEKKIFTLSVVDEFGNTPSDKLTTKDFLSIEGYVDNLFKPNNWNIYHYLTILGIFLVIVLGITLGVVHYRKKSQNQNNMYY